MNKISVLILLYFVCFLGSCSSEITIEDYGKQYQESRKYESLSKVVALLPENADTALVKQLLGEPIDMGFDYRYLLDSIGANGCSVGAVFHINSEGIIDQKWLDEICE